MKRLVVATRNRGKLAEIASRLAELGFAALDLDAVLPGLEIPEDADSFAGNALEKARSVSAASGLPTLADDSGLEVDALGGAPGVRSARYGGAGLSDAERCALLLEALSRVPGAGRTARFRAALAYVSPRGTERVFHGVLEGSIAGKASGEHGFGYDSIFVPNGCDRTLAELGPAVKERISHRALALAAFVAWLSKG